ncbi:MAG TPA: hypothetical protein VLA95_05665 [Gemmatimonadales bacterium]|nr:hypothetical protein [Gemmatimonadales bacterium]
MAGIPIPTAARGRLAGVFAQAGRVAGLLLVTLTLAPSARAQDAGWRIRLEPTYLDVHGHDQHVLTIHHVDAISVLDRKTAVALDTEAGTSYRAELRYTSGRWAWGTEFAWFQTKQASPDLARSGAGGGDVVTFEVADREFTSTGPGEVVYFQVLEDTEVALWTLDLFAERTLAASEGSHLALRLGVRFGDFDNDYRVVAGLENTVGSRFDAESNYGRMTGPLVGMAGTVRIGRGSLEGYVGQSVILGEAAFNTQARDFTGPFGGSPTYVAEETFGRSGDVAIPITDLQARGRYGLTEWLALGVGVNAAAWWDVGVPPGVVPGAGGDQVLHENTLVFFGLSGFVEFRF